MFFVILVYQDGPVLAYILDHLLPQCQSAGDKDCPALAQVLLASLAASNHSPEAQTVLVTEVKAALARALALPEGAEKHARVQSLTCKLFKQASGSSVNLCDFTRKL